MDGSRHVIDWSTATVEWSVDGFELVVALVSAASVRVVVAVADAIEAHLGDGFRDAGGTVVPIEPEDDEPAHLLVTSPALLSINPHGLRDLMNAAADGVANGLSVEEALDAERIAAWVGLLKQEKSGAR